MVALMESLNFKDLRITDIKGFDPNKIYWLNVSIDKNKVSLEEVHEQLVQLKSIFNSFNINVIISALLDGIDIKSIEPKEENNNNE